MINGFQFGFLNVRASRSAKHQLRALQFVAIIFFAHITPTQAAIPPAEQLLPADTLFVVTIPDCAKLRVISEKIPLVQFWNDAAMKPFRDKFIAQWNAEFIGPLERDLDVKLGDYSALPQGQLTFAMTKENWNAQDGNPPGSILLLDAKDKSSQLKTNLAELRKKWVAAGKPLKTEKIRGVDFSVVPMTTNSVPQTLRQFFPQRSDVQELGKETPKFEPGELVVGQHESLLIVANSVKVVDKILARLTGSTTPCLADDAGFEANRLAVFRDAPVFGWLNAKIVFDVLGKLPPEKPNPQAPNPLPPPDTAQAVSGTGLTALKSAAFAFRALDDGTQFEIFFDAPEATRKGLFKMFSVEPKDSSPPPFVPGDAVKFQRWRMDGQKFIAALEKTLADAFPQQHGTYNFLLTNGNDGAKIGDPTYDLRRDLFGNLGDDLITYEKPPRGNSAAEYDSPPSLLLIGSPNTDKLLTALKGVLLILSSDATNPKSREFLGRKILTIKLPVQVDDSGKAFTRELHYAASGGYVAFSTDVSMLEEFLRTSETPAKALRETDGLAEAAQKTGGQSSGLFAYENYNESIRATFAMLRQNPAGQTNSSASNPLAATPGLNPLAGNLPYAGPEKSFRDWMDFSLLPPFERVSKYFHFTIYSGSTSVDGLTLKFFSPTPPGLKQKQP